MDAFFDKKSTHPSRFPLIGSPLVNPQRFVYRLLQQLNRLVCRVMYGVSGTSLCSAPDHGPALIVCDHTSMGDPMVLLATFNRPIRFLMADEIYSKPLVKWAFQAFGCIPVQRQKRDVHAVRTMLDGLATGDVIGLFPEGGLERHRIHEGHPGIGYLAIKSGAPVIPASIVWKYPRSASSMIKTLLIPCKATIKYGAPLKFPQEFRPGKEAMQVCTKEIMKHIEVLRKCILSGESWGGKC